MPKRKMTPQERAELKERQRERANTKLKPYQFKPGEVHNPYGRPRLTEEEKQERADAKKILKAAAPTAAEMLVRMVNDPKFKKHFEACTEVLDRTIGKPNQPIGDEDGNIHIVFDSADGEDYSK